MAVVVEALDSSILDRPVHSFDLAVRPMVDGAGMPSRFQLDDFWNAHGMRSSMREAGCLFVMAAKVARR